MPTTSFNGQINKYLHSPSTVELELDNPTPSTIPTRTKSRTSYSPSLLRRYSSAPTTTKAKRIPSSYAPPVIFSHIPNNLSDSLGPSLIVLFVGLNPGLSTAVAGHAYSHPSNLFWRLLFRSGCTPRLCSPHEDYCLPRLFHLGLTNIVARTTHHGAQLSKEEMDGGVAVLEAKAAKWRPEVMCIVGKSIWESIWRVKHRRDITKEEFKYGWQDERERMGRGDGWDGSRVFVATTTSGVAANMRPQEKEAIWNTLGEWVQERRKEKEGTEAVQSVDKRAT